MLRQEYGHWWTRVASTLPGRDRKQVHHRWVNTVSPSVKQGPYSQEELLRLRVAVRVLEVARPQVLGTYHMRASARCIMHR